MGRGPDPDQHHAVPVRVAKDPAQRGSLRGRVSSLQAARALLIQEQDPRHGRNLRGVSVFLMHQLDLSTVSSTHITMSFRHTPNSATAT